MHMAGRSSTTLKKRQKEMARQDKQRDKLEKRAIRKTTEKLPGDKDDDIAELTMAEQIAREIAADGYILPR
jgi:hypothetical protein